MLGGPRPDSGDLDRVLPERRRREFGKALEVECSLDDRDRQFAAITPLLAAESDLLELPVVEGRERPPAPAMARTRLSFVKAARAEANDTCCSRMMWTRVANPGLRSHRGGVPSRSTTRPRSGSAAASSAAARFRVLSGSGCERRVHASRQTDGGRVAVRARCARPRGSVVDGSPSKWRERTLRGPFLRSALRSSRATSRSPASTGRQKYP